ncbi:FkbM family methyltransferase [Pseudomonas sp.]|uniref:FkbM family methyltransferase n=1 Tax=Pseudomonas sp. TaxID=306 RepID=UPI0031D51B57
MNPSFLSHIRSLAQRFPVGRNSMLLPRLMRSVFRHARGQANINDFDGNLHMRLDLSEHMQRRIFWIGYYNREIVALLNRLITPGMVIIDIGANIGEITLVAANRTTSAGRVIAFEPMKSIADQLEENIVKNALPWATAVRLGISDQMGEAHIYESAGDCQSNELNRGLGTLYPIQAGARPSQTISLTTLDRYIEEHPVERLDIIKIDIEGAELACLKGATTVLNQYRPMIIIEIQSETAANAGYEQSEILRFLSGIGYGFQRIGANGVLEHIDQDSLRDYQNVLCIHSQAET